MPQRAAVQLDVERQRAEEEGAPAARGAMAALLRSSVPRTLSKAFLPQPASAPRRRKVYVDPNRPCTPGTTQQGVSAALARRR